jgi:hypothetical protein
LSSVGDDGVRDIDYRGRVGGRVGARVENAICGTETGDNELRTTVKVEVGCRDTVGEDREVVLIRFERSTNTPETS